MYRTYYLLYNKYQTKQYRLHHFRKYWSFATKNPQYSKQSCLNHISFKPYDCNDIYSSSIDDYIPYFLFTYTECNLVQRKYPSLKRIPIQSFKNKIKSLYLATKYIIIKLDINLEHQTGLYNCLIDNASSYIHFHPSNISDIVYGKTSFTHNELHHIKPKLIGHHINYVIFNYDSFCHNLHLLY